MIDEHKTSNPSQHINVFDSDNAAMESSCSKSQEKELHQPQKLPDNAKERCIECFQLLHSHLKVLFERSGYLTRYECAFAYERAFTSLFGQDVQTFTVKMTQYLDQLEQQLDKENFSEERSMAAFCVINNQLQTFIDSQFTENQMTNKYFTNYTGIEVDALRETLLQLMSNVVKYIDERAQHKWMYDIMMNEQLILSREMQVDSSKALDASSVVTECSGTKSDMHDTSNSSVIHITHGVDADIRPVNDHVPFAEVHLTVQHNVPTSEWQHTDQSEPVYDTYLLEKVDSNTTPDSTNMSHKEGEIDQDVEHDRVKCSLLKAEFFKTNNMVEKEIYDELSNKFLQLEKHCISLEISIQQKEESFQTIKPCKNPEFPEFREFFEINNLKAQLQAKNSTINNLKTRINMHEKSNDAKIKHDIDALESRNFELECNVAKLLMENETLKKHYKDLYDSIKEKKIKTIEQTTSLMAKNDELKA
jgi:hypothetical protein